MNRTAVRADEGFTLIELLIAIAVMGIVLPALGTAFYVTMRTVDETSDRIGSSAGTTLAVASFGPDVQSAQTIAVGAATCAVPAGASALFTANRTDGSVTWFSDGSNLGRAACLTDDTSTTSLEVEPSSVGSVSCDVSPCGSKPATVSLSFTPLEGTPVRLSATRRNP